MLTLPGGSEAGDIAGKGAIVTGCCAMACAGEDKGAMVPYTVAPLVPV
jgi:hypothetical protein